MEEEFVAQGAGDFDVIPDTPSPVKNGSRKGHRRVAAETSNLARAKKLRQLQESASSTDDLLDPHPSASPKEQKPVAARVLLKSDGAMDTDSDSAISTSNKQENGTSAAVASGEDGDLSSDLEPPARLRKKKSPVTKVKSAGFLNLNWSDDSDLEEIPAMKTQTKTPKEKKSKRRSFLPTPCEVSDSAELNDCDDYFQEYMTNLRSENQGSLFPKLSIDLTSPDTKTNAPEKEESVILVSDDDEVKVKCKEKREDISSQPDMDTDTAIIHGGARPKFRTKHSHVFVESSTNSDSDSLLSPPKKSKASHTPERKPVKNRTRVMKLSDDTSPEGAKSDHIALPSPVHVSPQSAMNTDNESSDLDENEWEAAVLGSSNDRCKKTSPASRRKVKARRRTSTVPEQEKSKSMPDLTVTKGPEPLEDDMFCLPPSSTAFQPHGEGSNTERPMESQTSQPVQSTSNSASSLRAGTSSDSPLANMIVDMAIHDVDFEVEMTPPGGIFQPIERPPRPCAPRPRPCAPFPRPIDSSPEKPFFPDPTRVPHFLANGRSWDRSPPQRMQRLSHRVSPHFPDDDDDLDDFILGRFSPLSTRQHPRTPSPYVSTGLSDTDSERGGSSDVEVLGAEGGRGQSQLRMESMPQELRPPGSQVESDEAMARRLQEEMDKEFAAHLAGQPPTPGARGSRSRRQRNLPPHPWFQNDGPAYFPPVLVPGSSGGEFEGDAAKMRALQQLPHYDFEVHMALAEGSNIPDPPSHEERHLEDIVVPDLLNYVERYGAERMRDERAERARRNRASPASRVPPQSSVLNPSRRVRHRLVVHPDLTGGLMGDYEDLLALADRLGEVKSKGLKEEQIAEFPMRTYKKAKGPASSQAKEEVECHVCYSEYEEGEDLRRLPCLHEYHAACIDTWIKKNPTCPVCRADLLELYKNATNPLPT